MSPIREHMNRNILEFTVPEDFEIACRIQAFQGKICVGYANLFRKENIAILADICVYDRSKSLCRFLPKLRIGTNYRNKGIGSALLRQVIRFCKENDISTIKGEAKGDLDILIPWYKKHGFDIAENNKITMELHH